MTGRGIAATVSRFEELHVRHTVAAVFDELARRGHLQPRAACRYAMATVGARFIPALQCRYTRCPSAVSRSSKVTMSSSAPGKDLCTAVRHRHAVEG